MNKEVLSLCVVGVLVLGAIGLYIYLHIRAQELDAEEIDVDFDEFDNEAFEKFDRYSHEVWDTEYSRVVAFVGIIVLLAVLAAT